MWVCGLFMGLFRRTEPQYQHEHQRQPPKKTPGAMRLWRVARARAAGNSAGLAVSCAVCTVCLRFCTVVSTVVTVILLFAYGYFTVILRLFYGWFTVLYGYCTVLLRMDFRFLPYWRCIRHPPGSTDHPPLRRGLRGNGKYRLVY